VKKNFEVKVAVMGPAAKNTFRIYFGLFLAELICVPAFVFELSRALDGNTLSWAYVVEWPLLGGYAIYMWRKMLREEKGLDIRPVITPEEEDDPELRAWNDYLASVHKSPQGADPDSRAD
jgi:hypothetical protein